MTSAGQAVHVKVLRSSKKADTYVYLQIDAEYAQLPQVLQDQLGEAEQFLDFELTPERNLALADASQVLHAIAEQGFYLQMPPAEGNPIDELTKPKGLG